MKTIKLLLFSLLSTNLLFAQTIESVNPSTSASAFAIKGVMSSTSGGANSFAIKGEHNTTTNYGIGVWGSHAGSGWGVHGTSVSGIGVFGTSTTGYGIRGVITGNANSTSAAIFGQIDNGAKGRAGRFENLNSANEDANTFEVYSVGSGNIPDNTLGNASSFYLNNTNSVGAAVRGEVNTIFGNFGASGIFGVSSGTGGRAGLFYASNLNGSGNALTALTDGNGNAITANAGKDGNGVETNIDGAGTALYAWVPSFAVGKAGRFEIFNEDNENEVVSVKTIGNGTALSAKVDRTTGTSPALYGEVNSIFANFGTAGVYGKSSGTGGYAGLFYASNAAGNGPALLALTEGSGNGITTNAGGNGDGIEASVDGSGNAVFGWVPNFGTGKAGRFANFNSANSNPVLHVTNTGTGTATLINHTGSSGSVAVFQSNSINVARINKSGTGYFNGGTVNSGADVAELFDVTGNRDSYEQGDILVISKSGDRQVEKSNTPYSTLVAGVYATKPGVMLTEENIESDLSNKVPMGVVGVIPTKVCLEGGIIERGDMLVTSSVPGVAMKADPEKVKVGQVLGKALQSFNSETIGKIKVLVNVK